MIPMWTEILLVTIVFLVMFGLGSFAAFNSGDVALGVVLAMLTGLATAFGIFALLNPEVIPAIGIWFEGLFNR